MAGILTAVTVYLYWPTDTNTHTVARAAAGLLGPFALLAVVGAVVILGVNRARRSATIAVQVIVLTVAASLPVQLIVFGQALEKATRPLASPDIGFRTYLTAAEQSAMLWLRDHAHPDDVAVSNVFCMPAPYRPGCPDDAYWISGLSGVQLWIERLGICAGQPRRHQPQDELPAAAVALARSGPGQPDRGREAVRAASREPVGRRRRTLIIGDLRAGPVSPKLDRLADRVFSNKDVRIYRLR